MAKLKTVKTSEQFLDLARQSGVLEEEQLKSAEEMGPDPKSIARKMLQQEWLTPWQAGQLLCGYSRLCLGNYVLRDQIGRSEFGRVYLAQHRRLAKEVAIKLLSQRHARKQDSVRRFLAEARAAAALDHRHVIQVQDVDSDGERHFIVMEYVPGTDLRQRVLDHGPLPLHKVADFMRQTAAGMIYVHGQEIIHGDLKPANLQVDDQGLLKILDVGVGQLSQADLGETAQRGEPTPSTIKYLAPEQMLGEEIDSRADIYSLGCTMYFLLTGHVPFSAATEEQKEKIRETNAPLSVVELRNDAPANLVRICDKMRASRRDERYQSMREVESVLAAWLEDSPILEAELEPAAEEAEPGPRRDTASFQWKPAERDSSQDIDLEKTPAPKKARGDGKSIAAGSTDSAVPEVVSTPTARKSPAKVTPSPKTSETAAPPKGPGNKPSPWVLIIGLTAAVVILAGLGIGALLMRGRDPAPDVAQAKADDGGPPTKAEPIDPELDIEDVPDPEQDVTPSPSAASNGLQSTEPPTDGGLNEDSTAGAAAQVAAQTSSRAVEMGVSGAESGDESADGADEPQAKPEPKPVEKSTSEAEGSEEKPPPSDAAPKPEPEKSEPKPKKPPAKVFQLAAAVDLPPPPSGDESPGEKTLGRINIDAKDACFISMYGGELASRGKSKFVLRNADQGTAPRDWEFVLSNSKTDEVVIGTLALPAEDLVFAWSDQAGQHAASDYLRNCSLRITAGQAEPREVLLRTAQSESPLVIDFEKPQMSAKWNLAALPNLNAIRIAARIQGHKFARQPPDPIPGKGKQWIFFGENKVQAAVALELETKVTTRGVEVEAIPYLLVPRMPQPMRLTKANLKQFRETCLRASMRRKGAQDFIAKLNENKDQKKRMQNQFLQAQQAIQLGEEYAKRLEQFDQLQQAVQGVAQLQIRVYYDTLEKEVDLLVTNAVQPAVAAKE